MDKTVAERISANVNQFANCFVFVIKFIERLFLVQKFPFEQTLSTFYIWVRSFLLPEFPIFVLWKGGSPTRTIDLPKSHKYNADENREIWRLLSVARNETCGLGRWLPAFSENRFYNTGRRVAHEFVKYDYHDTVNNRTCLPPMFRARQRRYTVCVRSTRFIFSIVRKFQKTPISRNLKHSLISWPFDCY